MTTKLNPKQQRFVATYLIDLNATQAAIKAGYSKKTARSQGQRLLTHIDVSEAIAAKTVKRLEQLDVTAERVLREYARIGFMDIRKIFNDDGAMKPIGELGDDEAAVIAGVEVGEIVEDGVAIGRLKKIKLSDKLGALNSLAKHLGLLTDKVVVSGDPDNPIRLMLERIQGSAITPSYEHRSGGAIGVERIEALHAPH